MAGVTFQRGCLLWQPNSNGRVRGGRWAAWAAPGGKQKRWALSSGDPVSAMPVFDPSVCAPALLTALWRGFCGVADTINTKQMEQTDEVLDELQMRLHEHAAQLRETAPRARRLARSDGTLAKHYCALRGHRGYRSHRAPAKSRVKDKTRPQARSMLLDTAALLHSRTDKICMSFASISRRLVMIRAVSSKLERVCNIPGSMSSASTVVISCMAASFCAI